MDSTEPPPPPRSSDLPPGLRWRDAEEAVRFTAPPAPNRHRLNPLPLPHPLPAAPTPWEQEGSDHSGSEHYDSDGEESSILWQPITEDVTVPCTDELEFLVSKGEHSALDHEYWEKEAFFDLEDPELVPGESGRIDWLVEAFNGTEDNPNNETLMRSPVVRIGGLDWQIKFYPKGNGSQYLSVYIECISLLEPGYAPTEDFQPPPFPFLKGLPKIQKRRSVAAQLLVVMYNPEEPRVHEHRREAHQFHKKQADYGWVYFSRYPRSELHARQHTQRQAILRNDKLAFKAYVRIVGDSTGSKWEHDGQNVETSSEQIISVTGLRPFKKSLQYIAGVVPLLHFAPFRRLVQQLPVDTQLAHWLQPLLLKMYTRQRSSHYKSRGTIHEGDVMEMIWNISTAFHSESNDSALSQQWRDLVGVFHSEKGSACGANRLNTKDYTSIQDAVIHHSRGIACPQLLTLELTRQEHDKKARKWRKLSNKVRVDDHIEVNGSQYTLFAFITHCGHLMSSRYNSYVRPNGIGKGWYVYQGGLVTRISEKQARDCHSGPNADGGRSGSLSESTQDGHDSPFSELHEPQTEVPSVVMYVRDDVAVETFEASAVETWDLAHLRPLVSLISLPKLGSPEDVAAQLEPPISAMREQAKYRQASDAYDRAIVEEPAQDCLEGLIQRAADVATPEPLHVSGEDIIMRDADEDSFYLAEAVESEPADGTALIQGTYSWLGRCHYEGQWKDGKYHGGGYHIDTNGDEYLGRFENGLKHGFGKMIYAGTGDIYEGDWAVGKHHGRGRLTELSSGNVFEGGWQEGRKHGAFVLKGTVTEEDKSCCTICYDQEMTTAFYDCGHVVACRDCAARIEICPICRRDVHARLQLYGVKVSSG